MLCCFVIVAATLSHLSPSQHSTSSVSVKEKRRGYLERKNWKNKGRKGKKDDLGLRRPKPVSMRKCLLSRVTTRILWVFCISCLIQKCKEKVLLDKTLVFGEGFRKLLRRTDLNFFPLRTQEATLATVRAATGSILSTIALCAHWVVLNAFD